MRINPDCACTSNTSHPGIFITGRETRLTSGGPYHPLRTLPCLGSLILHYRSLPQTPESPTSQLTHAHRRPTLTCPPSHPHEGANPPPGPCPPSVRISASRLRLSFIRSTELSPLPGGTGLRCGNVCRGLQIIFKILRVAPPAPTGSVTLCVFFLR